MELDFEKPADDEVIVYGVYGSCGSYYGHRVREVDAQGDVKYFNNRPYNTRNHDFHHVRESMPRAKAIARLVPGDRSRLCAEAVDPIA